MNNERHNGGEFREAQFHLIETAVMSEARPGNKEKENQDSHLEYQRGDLFMAVISDGMGGVAGGAEASQLVIDGSEEAAIYSTEKQSLKDILTIALGMADTKIQRAQQLNPNHAGMGATFAGLVIRGDEFACANVGDTRIYRKRGTTWARLSTDHTVETKMLMEGRPPDEAAAGRSALTQAVGYGRNQIDPDHHQWPIHGGETFLLISDGAYAKLTEQELFDLIDEKDSAEMIAQKIINAAKKRELTDDATILIVKVGQ